MEGTPRIYREPTREERLEEEKVFWETLLEIVDPIAASMLFTRDEEPTIDPQSPVQDIDSSK